MNRTVSLEASPAGSAMQAVRVMLFTRIPVPGQTKTRLIPALGDVWAAELQRRMTCHLLRVCARWVAQSTRGSLEVWTADRDLKDAAHAFGSEYSYRIQASGDLGRRLACAFETKPEPAIALGADCPEIDDNILSRAARGLTTHDVVLGPAHDGGYYLIGMNVCRRELFEGIPWGTSAVFAATRSRAETLGLRVAYLPTLTDVDTLEDLPAWLRRHDDSANRPWISIVIPTLNEADMLAQTLDAIGQADGVEVIVADGGSTDATCQIAGERDATLIATPAGRAVQLNCGAAIAQSDLLLFLHADTRLPPDWDQLTREWLDRDEVAAAFRLRFDTTSAAMTAIAAGANLRARCFGLPYGDQGLVIRRETLGALDGYRLLPTMEDYELIRRLRKHGRIGILPGAVTTSARRYLEQGPLRTVLRHQWMILRWHLGGMRQTAETSMARKPQSKEKTHRNSTQQ